MQTYSVATKIGDFDQGLREFARGRVCEQGCFLVFSVRFDRCATSSVEFHKRLKLYIIVAPER